MILVRAVEVMICVTMMVVKNLWKMDFESDWSSIFNNTRDTRVYVSRRLFRGTTMGIPPT